MRPLLEAMGSRVLHVGPVGAGHALKALNNMLSAAHLLASCEALAIGRRFGLDPQVMLDAINTSSGASVSTTVKLPTYVLTESFDSGFGLGLMVKDVGIAVGLGEELEVPAALAQETLRLWREAAAALPADADHTEIARWVDSLPMSAHEVIAVRYGTVHSTKGDLFLRYGAYREPDAPQDMDFFFYVLRRDGEVTLVDTGFLPSDAPPRGRECLIAPADALAALEIEPASVARVIVTHCHWDHIGNLDLFRDAELYVPERELEFWAAPVARNRQFWSHTEAHAIAQLERARAQRRVTATGADEEILPGVRAITVGGHSAGQQIIVVDGTVVPRLRRGPPLRGARAGAAVRRRHRPARDDRGLRADQGAGGGGRRRRPGPRPAGRRALPDGATSR